MTHKLPIVLVVFLIILGFSRVQAQMTLTAASGNGSGSGGSMSFAVGQMIYSSNIDLLEYIEQFNQQQSENESGIDSSVNAMFECSIYPNPTSDYARLTVLNPSNEILIYQLFDYMGRLLETEAIKGPDTTIPLITYVSGTYFLSVSNIGDKKKFLVIIKTN